MPGYHMFQHLYPEQPARGLHNRVVWAEARQLPLLRIEPNYPLFLLWKLVSYKNVMNQLEEILAPSSPEVLIQLIDVSRLPVTGEG